MQSPVVLSIELARGVPVRVRSEIQEMNDRVYSGLGHILVLLQIVRSIEIGRRSQDSQLMGIDASLTHHISHKAGQVSADPAQLRT